MLVKKITLEWLEEKHAFSGDINWFIQQSKTDPIEVLKALIEENKLYLANWLIVRVMDRPQYLSYAIFAAEQAIDIFESVYPEDNRPRMAIAAARAVLENDTEETRAGARVAMRVARAAGHTGGSVPSAATSACVAWAAGEVARAAGYTGDAAIGAARSAVDVPWYALRILQYGLSLLEKEKSSAR